MSALDCSYLPAGYAVHAPTTPLHTPTLHWMLALIRPLAGMYARGSMPWSEHQKRAELIHPAHRFLVVANGSENVAFLAYRWDSVEGAEVVYVYELHVAEEERRKGIGLALMRKIEELAKEKRVYRIMLTVFKENRAAMAMYMHKLG